LLHAATIGRLTSFCKRGLPHLDALTVDAAFFCFKLPAMFNQRVLAKQLGLNQATVSRALRGDPSISKKTQTKVWQAAQKLGYMMNPLVSAAMEQVRSGRPVTEQGCIAVIVDEKSESEWFKEPVYKFQYEGMVRRAALRGYHLECFFLRSEDIVEGSLERILYSRGIAGVILAALAKRGRTSLDLLFERYASVAIGNSWNFLEVSRVGSDHLENLLRAFTEVTHRGYQRIGLSLPPSALNPKDSRWLGAYLIQEYYLPQAQRIPVFIGSPATTPLKPFRSWYEKWRPDVLLNLMGEEWSWMQEMGLSIKDMGLVSLTRPAGSHFSGIDANNGLVGEIASNVVINNLRDNERGLPVCPRQILVEGFWVDGETLPLRKP
jgi:LacI family transcriptional regulator